MTKIEQIQGLIIDNLDVRSFIRARAKAKGDRSMIRVVKGNAPPALVGERGYYTTPAGKRIDYPGAYKWPKVYHHSTVELAVSVGWLEKIKPSLKRLGEHPPCSVGDMMMTEDEIVVKIECVSKDHVRTDTGKTLHRSRVRVIPDTVRP